MSLFFFCVGQLSACLPEGLWSAVRAFYHILVHAQRAPSGPTGRRAPGPFFYPLFSPLTRSSHAGVCRRWCPASLTRHLRPHLTSRVRSTRFVVWFVFVSSLHVTHTSRSRVALPSCVDGARTRRRPPSRQHPTGKHTRFLPVSLFSFRPHLMRHALASRSARPRMVPYRLRSRVIICPSPCRGAIEVSFSFSHRSSPLMQRTFGCQRAF